MKIGVVTYHTYSTWDSLKHIQQGTAAVLGGRHELRPYPADFPFATRARQRELIKAWMTGCDVLLGPPDDLVLQSRAELDLRVPYVCFLMGNMTRGAVPLMDAHRYLRTFDVLAGNCAAEAALCEQFFENATTCVVPFGCDQTLFNPADEQTCRAVRASLGFEPQARIVMYSGRIAIEKNLQTLLRVFSVVHKAVPEARLVLAGPEMNNPFLEFGVFPLGIKRSLQRMVPQLGLDGCVLFVGRRTQEELRALYSTADLLVNLTLHHDENFGLAQIEAMSCGLPIVGSTWGGLKDTIAEGVNGVQVPAIVTSAGVKLDWWRAANAIVSLIERQRHDRSIRQRCVDVARERYSLERYGEHLEALLTSLAGAGRRTDVPLRPTPFAQQFWATCFTNGDGAPPYRRGPEAFRLYQEMITPFAAASTNGTRPHVPAATTADGQVWCLGAPLVMRDRDTIAVNDPLYPIEIQVPPPLVEAVRSLVEAFTEEPVLPVDRAGADETALAWMRGAGLVIRTEAGTLDPAYARGSLGRPLLQMQAIDHRIDVVWVF